MAFLLAFLLLDGATQAENLLANGQLDWPDGIAGWSPIQGSITADEDVDQCAASDSIHGSSAPSGSGIEFLTFMAAQCVAVDGSLHDHILASASWRSTGAVWGRLDLMVYETEDCSDAPTFPSAIFSDPSSVWTRLSGTFALPSSTRAVQLVAQNNPLIASEPAFTADWDRFYLGFEDEILVDGFELDGGTTCRWAATVP